MIKSQTTMQIKVESIENNTSICGNFSCKIFGNRIGQLNILHFFVKDKMVFIELTRKMAFSYGGVINCNIEIELNCNGENPKMYIKSIIN